MGRDGARERYRSGKNVSQSTMFSHSDQGAIIPLRPELPYLSLTPPVLQKCVLVRDIRKGGGGAATAYSRLSLSLRMHTVDGHVVPSWG